MTKRAITSRTACLLAAWLLAAGAAATRAQEAPEVLFRRAEKLDQEGNAAKAAEQYQAFLEQHPDHSQAPEAHYRLARCLDAVGKVDDAIGHLQTATADRSRRFRSRADALYQLGKLLGDIGEHARAVEAFERLLAEGAGLYEEEVLNLCGGYYAVLGKHAEAAAKFNILKRRPNSRFAEAAAYKLCLLWLESGNLELAVEAVGDLATSYPANQEARGLMLRLAGVFREQRKFDQAIAVCEQVKTRFPEAREAKAAGYVIGLCQRDRKEFDKAVATLTAVARDPENARTGLAAEAVLKVADIHLFDLRQTDRAMGFYEEAAGHAREHADAERGSQILEQCYFRLAEYYFARQKWSVALEFYALLRDVGTEINILPRIMKCQAELDVNLNAFVRRDEELAFLKKRIEEMPGTFAAAEGEVFLADRELERLKGESRVAEERYRKVAALYADILRRYPRDVLTGYHLLSYIQVQLGHCYAGLYQARRQADPAADGWQDAIAAFERALEVEPGTPYRQEVLEWVARIADAAGQQRKAFDTYQALYTMAGEKLKENEQDARAAGEMTGYLRSMLARAGDASSIEPALALAQRIIDEEGVGSPAARHALFYTGELHYLNKDFSAAAKAYGRFVRTYGPPQDPDGNLAGGPWQVERLDDNTRQVYEAAVRIAQSWYMQGHAQNTVKAYRWIVDNVPNQNRYVAEARYWLAMELAKGRDAETPERRRELATAMWTGVVAPWFLDSPPDETPAAGGKRRAEREAPRYYFWVHDRDMEKYARTAIIKSGELLDGLKEHRLAARAFAAYLELYPPPQPRRDEPPPPPDELYRIARYMLGQCHIALGEIDKMADVYKPYLSGERDNRFRLPALRFLGFHASRGELVERGVEAYATILDEYGPNDLDKEGEPVPLPKEKRIREGNYDWDGIRLPPPEGLDLGQVRYALGFLYWKNEDWPTCIRTLLPFLTDGDLRANPSRAKAVYMVGRSYYRTYEFARGVEVLRRLVREHPTFDAAEEAFSEAARGAARLERWDLVAELYGQFVAAHPQSPYRPHLDLQAAVAMTFTGRAEDGRTRLEALLKSDAYEDVKADACYHLGRLLLTVREPAAGAGGFRPEPGERERRRALEYFERSLEYYPRERTLVAAARARMGLGEWEQARSLLNRALTDFGGGDRAVIEEARQLLPQVLTAIAKQKE